MKKIFKYCLMVLSIVILIYHNDVNAQVTVITVPSNLGRYQTYTNFFEWDWQGEPLRVIKQLGGTSENYLTGDINISHYGIVTFGEYFAVAMTSTFGEIGDILFVEQDNGTLIPVIIADEKSQSYAEWDDNPANEWGHNDGQNIIEFEIGEDYYNCLSFWNLTGPNNEFDYYITKAYNVGNVYDNYNLVNDINSAFNLIDSNTTLTIDDVITVEKLNESYLNNINTDTYMRWLQTDSRWANVVIDNTNKTISSDGNYVTSLAMLIKHSNSSININNFNPGTFVEVLNNNSGFTNGLYNSNYSALEKVTNNFVTYSTNNTLTGTREEKTNTIKELLEDYYILLSVENQGGHWVAIDKVLNGKIYMMDPKSKYILLWDEKYNVDDTNTYTLYKKNNNISNNLNSTLTASYKYYNQGLGDGSDGIHFGSYTYKCRNININQAGCGPTAIAMIASGLVSSNITPITIVDTMCDLGWDGYMDPSWLNNRTLMSKVGMNATLLFDSSSSLADKKAKIVDIINKGYPVIIDNPYHYVALIPGSNGKIKLLDPGSEEKTKEYTIDELVNITWQGSNEWRTAYYYNKVNINNNNNNNKEDINVDKQNKENANISNPKTGIDNNISFIVVLILLSTTSYLLYKKYNCKI